MSFDSIVLFHLFIFLSSEKNEVLKKCFMINFYIPHSENVYTSQNAKYSIKIVQ